MEHLLGQSRSIDPGSPGGHPRLRERLLKRGTAIVDAVREVQPEAKKADEEAEASGDYTAAPVEPSGSLDEDANEALAALREKLQSES